MNNKTSGRIFLNPAIVIAVLFILVASGYAQTVTKSAKLETEQRRDERMKWWREARFGMFIHWGIYAVPASTYALSVRPKTMPHRMVMNLKSVTLVPIKK